MNARATASPAEALDWLSAGEQFHALVIDYKMPSMNGVELARRVRDIRGANAPPMVLFTSVTPADPDFWQDVRQARFATVLTKPAKSAQLLKALATALGPKSAAAPSWDDTTPSHDPVPADLSILVVDDNRINLKVASKLLMKLGFASETAQSGQDAIDQCVSWAFDVVLMDIEMPEMDGLTAAAAIRDGADADRRPYIVALTANALVSAREKYLQAGMDDYISKPISEEALVASLRSAARFREQSGQDLQTVAREARS